MTWREYLTGQIREFQRSDGRKSLHDFLVAALERDRPWPEELIETPHVQGDPVPDQPTVVTVPA